MTNLSNSVTGLDSDKAIDARHTDGPVTLIKLKSKIKTVKTGTTLSIFTTEDEAELKLRSFCNATHNQYLGCDQEMGYDVHWVKKTQPEKECRTCGTVRTLLAGVVTAGILTYTSPDIVAGGASGITNILFILSVCALPPVAYNIYRLAKQNMLRLLSNQGASA